MIFYNPRIEHKFLDYGILIPIKGDRSTRVFEALKKDYPSLLKETSLDDFVLFSKEDLKLAHNSDFVERLFGSEEEIQKEIFKAYELYDEKTGEFFRYDPKIQKHSFSHLRDVILRQGSMTFRSTEEAIKTGFSFHLGGGMHHAMSFGGRGFCLYNDLVVTLKKLKQEKKIKEAWIIDIDVHKGDGAAELLVNDPWIKTFSIHMKHGWPLNEGKETDPWFIPSTVDVPVDINEEHLYLQKLEEGLTRLSKLSTPDVVIVVDGADPFEFDELPSSALIKLSKEDMLKRDLMVYRFLKERDIPQSYVMAGGYGERSWEIWYQFLYEVLKERT